MNETASISQAYIPKRRTLIQVLPPLNAYTKSVHAYIHFVKSFCCLLMHICILPENCNKTCHSLIAITRQIAYMHEQTTMVFL